MKQMQTIAGSGDGRKVFGPTAVLIAKFIPGALFLCPEKASIESKWKLSPIKNSIELSFWYCCKGIVLKAFPPPFYHFGALSYFHPRDGTTHPRGFSCMIIDVSILALMGYTTPAAMDNNRILLM